jgi:hypothetical protein
MSLREPIKPSLWKKWDQHAMESGQFPPPRAREVSLNMVEVEESSSPPISSKESSKANYHRRFHTFITTFSFGKLSSTFLISKTSPDVQRLSFTKRSLRWEVKVR